MELLNSPKLNNSKCRIIYAQPLNQEIQNSRRHLIAQMRIPLQKTGNIGKILLTFAAAPSLIRHSPNFPLKHVLNTRNWKSYSQDVS